MLEQSRYVGAKPRGEERRRCQKIGCDDGNWMKMGFLIFVVPSIMLYSSEISPTRCNNCVFILRNGFTLHDRVTISPIIRSTYAVYGHR